MLIKDEKALQKRCQMAGEKHRKEAGLEGSTPDNSGSLDESKTW